MVGVHPHCLFLNCEVSGLAHFDPEKTGNVGIECRAPKQTPFADFVRDTKPVQVE